MLLVIASSIEDREFNDSWEHGCEYEHDERNYIQHHELLHKVDMRGPRQKGASQAGEVRSTYLLETQNKGELGL